MERSGEGLPTSLLAQALESGRLVLGAEAGPRWRSLLAVPESVSQARRFTEGVLAEVAEVDAEHVDDVVLVVSELITNGVREVARHNRAVDGARPVHLGVAVRPRWTHILAVDSAPDLPREAMRGPLPISGRGIPIIRHLAAVTWVEVARRSKTVHAVVTRTGVELTPQEREALDP
jgi:anti-sigma regulatory factor (Ser/Thr protein kinase)